MKKKAVKPVKDPSLKPPDPKALIQAFALARQSLVGYRSIILKNNLGAEVKPASFHYEWSNAILYGTGNIAYMAYRESAKTQIIMRSFLLYAITFPSVERDYIVLIKDNATLAGNKLVEIETEALSNPVIRANIVKVNKQSSDVFDVDIKNEGKIINVRIEAYGKGASIRGLSSQDRRPKIVIIDDPQSLDDARSEAVTAADWDWFLADVKFLGQHTRIFLIGNNLGDRCIVPQVFANAAELGFQTFIVPQIVIKDGVEVSAWPEKTTLEDIYKERENYRKIGKIDVWTREKLCKSVSEEIQVFHRSDYRWYHYTLAQQIAQTCNVYMRLDPATSKNPGACFRALPIVGVDKGNNWFVLDVPYGRWGPVELIDMVFAKVRQWRPKNVGIEKGQLKDIYEVLLQREMAERRCFFNIVGIEHAKAGSKLERVKALAPRVASHHFYLPDEAEWLPELETELAGVTKSGFTSMFQDLVDSLAMCDQESDAPFDSNDQVDEEGQPRRPVLPPKATMKSLLR